MNVYVDWLFNFVCVQWLCVMCDVCGNEYCVGVRTSARVA